MTKGGLKLVLSDRSIYNVGFSPIYDMLMNKGSKLTLLTASSLKGFIFILDVPEKASRYLDLNNNNTDFTKIVTSFILKFTITASSNDTFLDVFQTKDENNKKIYKNKYSESRNSFYEEAKIQQSVWKDSIRGGKKEICPSVANFSLLDINNSNTLLVDCMKLVKKSSKEYKVLHFLHNTINSKINGLDGLGIITMKNYKGSKTLYHYMNDKSISSSELAITLPNLFFSKLYVNPSSKIIFLL